MATRRNNHESPQPDPLADYRAAIAELNAAQEKLGTLQALRVDLEGQLRLAQFDHEHAMANASQADELATQDADELIRHSTRMEVLRRKVLDVVHRLEVAEAERIALVRQTASRFSSLWRSFLWFSTEKEVERLKAGLAAPCDGNLLAVVAGCSHAVIAVKKLDIVLSDDATSLVAMAGKLLEAVSNADGFPIPPWQPSEPTASAAPDNVGLPWLGRGMTQREIEQEFERIRLADPSLDIGASYRKMKELHPELFSPPPQTEPVLDQPFEWRAGLIGSTRTQ